MRSSSFWLLASLAVLSTASLLQVLSPKTLAAQFTREWGMIQNNLANYGDVPFGASMMGRLYFQSKNSDGCHQYEDIDHRGDPDDEFTPIFLAIRGGCTFVQKSRRAQNAGAKLLLIQNNVEGMNINSILMSDDGTGRDITIPTVMISDTDGQTLRTYLAHDQRRAENFVTLKSSFEIWQRDYVNYDIYFAASQLSFYSFLRQMYPFQQRLDNTTMTPHFRVHSYSGDVDDTNPDCYGKGKYCLFNEIQASGRQVIREQIRQLCVLQKHSGLPQQTDAWFKYVSAFADYKCTIADQACSHRALEEAGLNGAAIEDCVTHSFHYNAAANVTEIPVLDAEIQEWYRTWNPMIYPAVLINHVQYRGNFEGEDVFRMICASYKDEPKGCTDYFDPHDSAGGVGGTGLSIGAIIGIIVAIILVNVIVICCYRRYSKREFNRQLNQQVDSAVSAYFALRDQDTGSELEAK